MMWRVEKEWDGKRIRNSLNEYRGRLVDGSENGEDERVVMEGGMRG